MWGEGGVVWVGGGGGVLCVCVSGGGGCVCVSVPPSIYLTLSARTTISNRPVNTMVTVNSTAFLACQASHDPALDLQTAWYFQGRPLYWRDLHYKRVTPLWLILYVTLPPEISRIDTWSDPSYRLER